LPPIEEKMWERELNPRDFGWRKRVSSEKRKDETRSKIVKFMVPGGSFRMAIKDKRVRRSLSTKKGRGYLWE